MRAEAEKNKVPFRYPAELKRKYCSPDFVPPADVSPVVRISTEEEGSTGWDDGVQGRIDFPNKDVDDFIILRADGSPTYLLAVVVDDHDMEISHVIRGSDHISNTPRQLQIYKACGWTPPDFGHIPLIHGPDGQKLSKRHGATGVEQYEALGYLPEAMRNYLSRLSWAHGNDEIFSTEQAIEWFTLEGCSKSASCFDYDKLKDLNAHYIKECDNERLRNLAIKLYPELAPFQKQVWCGARPFGAASAMRTPLHQSRTPLTRGTHTHAHSTTRPRRTPAQAAGHSGVRLNSASTLNLPSSELNNTPHTCGTRSWTWGWRCSSRAPRQWASIKTRPPLSGARGRWRWRRRRLKTCSPTSTSRRWPALWNSLAVTPATGARLPWSRCSSSSVRTRASSSGSSPSLCAPHLRVPTPPQASTRCVGGGCSFFGGGGGFVGVCAVRVFCVVVGNGV